MHFYKEEIMFPSDIVIGTRTFSKVSQDITSSVYSDRDVTAPEEAILTISHQVTKAGRVNSAAILYEKKLTGGFYANGDPVFDEFTKLSKQSSPENTALDKDTILNDMTTLVTTFDADATTRVLLNNLEH
jgi:hypothetical protein